MKKLSEIYKELGIAFTLPIEIKDSNGNETYFENSNGYWQRREYDAKGNETYCKTSTGYWYRRKYDANGNDTYYENSDGFWRTQYAGIYGGTGNTAKYEYDAMENETYYESSAGYKRGIPRDAKTCEGKVVEVDGIKYRLKAL